jgi:hypothetical protein
VSCRLPNFVIASALDVSWLWAAIMLTSLLMVSERLKPTTNSPTPDAWKLTRESSKENWSLWNPSTLDSERPIFITSTVQDHLPSITTTLPVRTWVWARPTRALMLPLGDVFLLQGDNPILVYLWYLSAYFSRKSGASDICKSSRFE